MYVRDSKVTFTSKIKDEGSTGLIFQKCTKH
jgi:hypothetical protein